MNSSLVEDAGVVAAARRRAQREQNPGVGKLLLDLLEVPGRADDDLADPLARRVTEVGGDEAGPAVQGHAGGRNARGGGELDLILVPG